MPSDDEEVVLTLDEYEVVRLVDREGQTHEQCARQMEIARSTVTEIYESARRKLAACIVDGRRLVIRGGDVRLCDGSPRRCYKQCCAKRSCRLQQSRKKEGERDMRIAVAYDGGTVFQHFGHTEQFKLYEVEDGAVVSSRLIGTNGSGHGALAGLLAEVGADVLICGGIGGGAQTALAEAGIRLYGGVAGDADAAVAAFLADSLAYNPDVRCSHHDSDGAHACGVHGCGKHDCH